MGGTGKSPLKKSMIVMQPQTDCFSHPNQVQQWKKKLMEGASEIFQSKAERKENKPYTEDDLMRKIGRLEIENDFLRSVSLACGLNPEKLK